MLLEAFGSPAWVFKTLLGLFLIGFPFALFFAWAFELTRDGLKRTEEVEAGKHEKKKATKKKAAKKKTAKKKPVGPALFDMEDDE